MATVNQKEPETKVTEMSIVSLSIFAAVCLALIAALITRPTFEVGFNAYCIAIGMLLLAILFFLFANDNFLLMIYYPEKRFFGVAGSALYGLGEVSMIVGISVGLSALASNLIGYLFLAAFTLGFVGYNVARFCQVGWEIPVKTRLTLRFLSLFLLILGFVIIWKI